MIAERLRRDKMFTTVALNFPKQRIYSNQKVNYIKLEWNIE